MNAFLRKPTLTANLAVAATLALLLSFGCGGYVVNNEPDGSTPPDGEDAQTPTSDAETPTSDGTTPDPDGESPPDPDGGPAGPTVYIYVEGDTAPKVINDGLSGQTPRNYTMSLSRYDIMTSAGDPNPVTVFDYGTNNRVIDMLGRTLAGQAELASLPEGTYTHGRVRLTTAAFTVDAVMHYMQNSIPGPADVFGVLSDTVVDGVPRQKGEATYGFMGQTVPGTLPPLPTTGGGAIVEENGSTWLVFAFGQPLVVSHSDPASHEATIIFEVYESFRWQDLAEPDYQDGVFDVSPTTWEPVFSFGATGYRIEVD